MFQDEAFPLSVLRASLGEDSDEGEMAGGGGGPEASASESAGTDAGETAQDGDVAAAGAEPVSDASSDAEQSAQAVEAPVDTASSDAVPSPEPEPEAEKADVHLDDAAAFEEALKAMPAERGRTDFSGAFQPLREHDVVEGTVVHIDREGVLVDVGMKSEGIIRLNELTRDSFQDPEEIVSVGQRIKVYVLQTENSEGNLLLSKKRADFEVAWEHVAEAEKKNEVLNAMVTDRVKGGLVVDLGIRGFVPASHVGSGRVKNLEKYIGQTLPLRVIEVDRERRKVVLSHRMAMEEEREKKRAETLETLQEGQIRSGIVRRITDYGAFVDLGGIDGLLHISEMAWTRISHPSEVVKVGQKIQVMVLKMNLESGRVSLGMRQIMPDPWQNLGGKYKVGDIIQVRISRLVPFGAFVQLEEGVEAIIPNQELSLRRIKKPEQVVSIGDEVEARIMEVRPDERRMTLSMRALIQDREAEVQSLSMQQPHHAGPVREAPKTTVAELLGDDFAARREEFEKEFQRETKAKSRARKKARERAAEEAEEDAFGDLSDDELLDLAVDSAAEGEAGEATGDEAGAEAGVVEEGVVEETGEALEEVAESGEEESVEDTPTEEETPPDESADDASEETES